MLYLLLPFATFASHDLRGHGGLFWAGICHGIHDTEEGAMTLFIYYLIFPIHFSSSILWTWPLPDRQILIDFCRRDEVRQLTSTAVWTILVWSPKKRMFWNVRSTAHLLDGPVPFAWQLVELAGPAHVLDKKLCEWGRDPFAQQTIKIRACQPN